MAVSEQQDTMGDALSGLRRALRESGPGRALRAIAEYVERDPWVQVGLLWLGWWLALVGVAVCAGTVAGKH